jgi:hypothetical protein
MAFCFMNFNVLNILNYLCACKQRSMLEQRLDSFFSRCESALADINVKEIRADVAMDELCVELWRPLESELLACSLLGRGTPCVLLERLLNWAVITCEEHLVRRKFSSSFGSLRTDKDGTLTFPEMKRVSISFTFFVDP